MRLLGVVAAGFLMAQSLLGCVVVGYSTRGGWFVWPRGVWVLAGILFVVFLLRRRR